MDFDENADHGDGDHEDGEGNLDDIFAGGDENNEGGDAHKSMKDSVIFLVDCRRHLFEKGPNDSKSQFEVVVSAVSSFMKAKIVTNDNDKIAVILFNVNKQSNGMNFKGINTVFNLDIPDAERIKTITNLHKNFEREYGFADQETLLYEALWLCNHEFKNLDKRTTKRIFLFTPEDFPNATKKSERDQAVQHAKHLTEMNVDIELFPLKKLNNTKFDVKRFYADLIAVDEDEVNTGTFDSSSKMMQLTNRIKQKEFKKRTLTRLEFALAPGLKIGIRVYTTIKATSRPYGTNLDARTNKPLKNKSSVLCEDTGSILNPAQIGTYFELGAEKVNFKKEDVAEIKKFDEPSLKLMGFKPRNRIKAYHNIRSSYFVYPDDERITGSTQLADAMIKQMVAKDKVAIVRFVPRQTSAVRFCALFPQQETFDEDNFQTPPGFNLIFLPFADDIRKPDSVKPVKKGDASRENIVNAKVLIKALNLDFDSRNFTNPNIQNFFTRLQAIALNEEEPEEIEDLLEPDEEGFKNYESFIESFKSSVFGDRYTEPTETKPSRGRGGTDAAGGKRTKKEKVDIITEEDDAKPARGKRGGKRGKADDDEDDGPDMDEYDTTDGFVVDDRPKKSRGKSAKASTSKMDVEYEAANDDDIVGDVEKNLRNGDIKKVTVKMLKDYLKVKGLNVDGKKDDLVTRALNHLSQ